MLALIHSGVRLRTLELQSGGSARLQLLLYLTNRITSNLELQDLLRAISANIREVMHCEAVAIYLADSASGSFIVHALDILSAGQRIIKEGLQLTPPKNDPLKRAFFDTYRKPVIVNTDEARRHLSRGADKISSPPEGFKSPHFFVPLASHGRVLRGDSPLDTRQRRLSSKTRRCRVPQAQASGQPDRHRP